MRSAGIDIGSRTIEVIAIENGRVVSALQMDTTHDLLSACECLLGKVEFDRLIATGYGRSLAEIAFDAPTVTEIKAFARGARTLFPSCRSVLDIGGQDTKAIALDEEGRPVRFEMNDRCAAGTGRFLEVMARALDYDLDQFGEAALRAANEIQLSSMCTVFAESEVTGLLTKGGRREDIARAVHTSVLNRTVSLLGRVGTQHPVVFAGGVARNPCLREMIEAALGKPVMIPEDPQMVGAYGAALIAEMGS
jgi:predicted CoA-substrate-specific enzyme activase